MKLKSLVLAAALFAGLTPLSVHAQLVREDGVKSIAGVLVPGSQDAVAWSFNSSGGKIVFATLDAEVYRDQRGGEHEIVPLAGEGCTDEGGPGLFYLEVVRHADGKIICHAEKPLPPPGWQRDPRMACLLPASTGQTEYLLKVGLLPSEEIMQPFYNFLLNVSVRGIAPSGTNLQSAIAASSAGGF